MATDQRGRVRTEPGEKRVRAYLGGQLVLDTTHPLLVWEVPYYPTYYVPAADVVAEVESTGKTDHSPSRGDAEVLTLRTADHEAVGAALRYPDSPIEALRDHVRVDWDAMDAWFEEDEEVFTHVRSPYSRIDILPTSREVVVRHGDVELARSTRAQALFETGLPVRWYVPKADVRMDLLRPSDTVTRCPYKGTTVHFNAEVGDDRVDDVAWAYPTPLPESQRIAGLLSFYDGKVTVEVDGEPQGTPPA
jgi:uncharacterized protein (DUF427 family)